MVNLKFADTHDMVLFLEKSTESAGFEEIVDFLNAYIIKYELTINPIIYTSCIQQLWATAKVKTINGEAQLHALVDGKKIIITESIVRRDLQLEDAEGVDCLPIATIFEQLTLMGSKTTSWNEFSSTMASAIICLATNQKFNFSKYIFENKAIYKERDDSLVRADTTASSLEVEQDSGISGPSAEETMRDTIHSNLAQAQEVLDLETTKTAQAQEITMESSEDESLGKEDASKQGRSVDDIDADDNIILVQDVDKEVEYVDLDLFGLNDLLGDEVFGSEEQIVDTAQVTTTAPIVSTAPTTTTTGITDVEITLAQALAELKSAKPKANKVVKQELEQGTTTTTTAATTITTASTRPKTKGLVIHEQEQAPTSIAIINADYQLAQRLQAQEQEELIDEEKARLVTTFVDYMMELVEEGSKKAEAKVIEAEVWCGGGRDEDGDGVKVVVAVIAAAVVREDDDGVVGAGDVGGVEMELRSDGWPEVMKVLRRCGDSGDGDDDVGGVRWPSPESSRNPAGKGGAAPERGGGRRCSLYILKDPSEVLSVRGSHNSRDSISLKASNSWRDLRDRYGLQGEGGLRGEGWGSLRRRSGVYEEKVEGLRGEGRGSSPNSTEVRL
ncbi:hypothetical protein Tco_1429113, partial [Tanacetum coccineum]